MNSRINERFPTEVIVTILSHLNSIEIARLSRVCKRWNDIAKSNKILWRDASYSEGEYGSESQLALAHERINILRARSGGTLDHLNIQINTRSNFETQMKLLSELPGMNLQRLRLLLKDDDGWQYGTGPFFIDYHNEVSAAKFFKSLKLAVRTALAGCIKLNSLTIEDVGGFLRSYGLSQSESEFHPPADWKLQTFIAHGINCQEFFGEDTLHSVLNNPRIIKIGGSAIQEKVALNLIGAAKDTLEECQIAVYKERESPNITTKQIILPKLVKFHLDLHNTSSGVKPTSQAFNKVSFQWPKIKEIILEGQARLNLYERLVPTSIDSLQFRYVQDLHLKQMMDFLKKRTKLRKLAVENLIEDTDAFLRQILIDLWQIPIEDF